ncbi:MAG: hypothetical protein WBV84_02415 [Nitrososphaeraceae archaeon]
MPRRTDPDYQLGAYYDMRYMQYFTRYRFIQDLSSYDEDDTVSEREEEQKVMEDYPLLDIQQSEAKRREEYNDMPVNNTLQQMIYNYNKYGLYIQHFYFHR